MQNVYPKSIGKGTQNIQPIQTIGRILFSKMSNQPPYIDRRKKINGIIFKKTHRFSFAAYFNGHTTPIFISQKTLKLYIYEDNYYYFLHKHRYFVDFSRHVVLLGVPEK